MVGFYEPDKAFKYAYGDNKVFSPGKEKKVSFVDKEIKKKTKLPSPGQYNTDKAFKMLSSSPSGSISARRR